MMGKTQTELETLKRRNRRLRRGQHITIIEVGYCVDWRDEAKREQKLQQHADLVLTLKELGFQVEYNAKMHVVPLGHGGSVYAGLGTLMTDMKVAKPSVTKLVRKLVRNAAEFAHSIVTARRHIESGETATRQTQVQTQPRGTKRPRTAG